MPTNIVRRSFRIKVARLEILKATLAQLIVEIALPLVGAAEVDVLCLTRKMLV
jgi:hypothetical protein